MGDLSPPLCACVSICLPFKEEMKRNKTKKNHHEHHTPTCRCKAGSLSPSPLRAGLWARPGLPLLLPRLPAVTCDHMTTPGQQKRHASLQGSPHVRHSLLSLCLRWGPPRTPHTPQGTMWGPLRPGAPSTGAEQDGASQKRRANSSTLPGGFQGVCFLSDSCRPALGRQPGARGRSHSGAPGLRKDKTTGTGSLRAQQRTLDQCGHGNGE